MFLQLENDNHSYDRESNTGPIVFYLGCYVARKALKLFPCDSCEEMLLADSCDDEYLVSLVKIRTKGLLVRASKSLFRHLKDLENCISNVLRTVPLCAYTFQLILH